MNGNLWTCDSVKVDGRFIVSDKHKKLLKCDCVWTFFIKSISRCRSIASLDVENIVKGTESNGDGDIIEDEKGKTSNNKVNFSNKTSSDDNIQLKDYKSGSRQNRTRKQAINTWSAEQEPTGRGENIQKVKKLLV